MIVPLLTALALAAQEPALGPDRAELPAEVSVDDALTSMKRAVDWLLETQHEDGSWASPAMEGVLEMGFSVETYYAWQVAANALAVLALARIEETPARRAALESGLRFLCTTREPKRGSDWDSDYVWAALYGAVVCAECSADPRFAEEPWASMLDEAGRRYCAILLATQTPAGGWAYYDDPIYSRRPKWDTSFCTALILPTLARCLQLGWIEDERVLERARKYVKRCALPNGAYGYSYAPVPRLTGGEDINDVKGSLGRIQVCNWGLASVGEKKITAERLREGLSAFFRHHRFLDVARMRPIPHEAYYYNAGYFYLFGHYYAAEAIQLLPAQERGEWHAKLRPALLRTQRRDGSAADFLVTGYERVASTAFLVLGLQLGLE